MSVYKCYHAVHTHHIRSLLLRPLRLQDDRAAGLALYSQERALDAQALVVESHKADQGFWQFIFPMIMDSAFNKIFPALFRPSMFKSMNMGDARYSEVRRRKRLDRTVQFAMIGGVIAAVFTMFWQLVAWLV